MLLDNFPEAKNYSFCPLGKKQSKTVLNFGVVIRRLSCTSSNICIAHWKDTFFFFNGISKKSFCRSSKISEHSGSRTMISSTVNTSTNNAHLDLFFALWKIFQSENNKSKMHIVLIDGFIYLSFFFSAIPSFVVIHYRWMNITRLHSFCTQHCPFGTVSACGHILGTSCTSMVQNEKILLVLHQ